MEKYQFRIEDVIVSNPEGWKDFELRLKRDDDIAGLLVTSTNKFTFRGDGYRALKSRFDGNYNDKVIVAIDILQSGNTYLEKYSGVVILTDVEFNLERLTATTTVEDANFQGAIQGNKNVKSFLNAGLTKNGEQVTVLTVYNLDYFQNICNYQSLANRRAYRLKDALDFMVRFMTDDVVKGVQSIYLDDVDNFEGASLLYITTGVSIRLANQAAPNVSFSQLIIFLQKTHDLTFDFVTDTNGDPVMRIEQRAFFFNSTNSDTMRDLSDLTVTINKDKIASHLEVGNELDGISGNCSTTTRFFTFESEDYSLRGKGNVDKLIDLKTEFVTNSNPIEDIIQNNADTYDEEIFIIMGNVAGTQASQFQTVDYCSNLCFYNLGFTNDNIIDRQLEAVPNSVTKYLTGATTPAKAELGATVNGDFGTLSTAQNTPVPIVLNVDYINQIYDLGGNYQDNLPITYYDVPFAGDFSFEGAVKMIFSITDIFSFITGFNEARLRFQIAIRRFDATFSTLIEESLSPAILIDFDNAVVGDLKSAETSVANTMTCATGDRVLITILMEVTRSTAIEEIEWFIVSSNQKTFFKCLGTPTDAGTYKVFDPNSFRARRYKFEKNVSLNRSDNIRANTRNSVVINELSDTTLDKTTWIEEMVTNIETGRNSFTMMN